MRMRAWLALAAVAGVSAFGAWRATVVVGDLKRPLQLADAEYVGSNACRSCHPAQHRTWHRTFHRTMTQEASATSVLGDFDEARFDYLGVQTRFTRDEHGQAWMHFTRAGGAERWSARVDRTVGSHRYQQYLTREGDVYLRLPLAWNIAEGRWMHLNAAFLVSDPPEPADGSAVARADHDRHVTRWNDNCIYCHNVGPNPGLADDGSFDSHVAELGIACEACHGPASAHVAINGSPLRRYALHLARRADPTIAHPERLGPARSAEVCGRCHGQRITPDIAAFHRHGDRWRPDEPLSHYSRPLWRDTPLHGDRDAFAPRFWRDGTPRLTAYEYQGLLLSPCAQNGELTCESCHAMHEGEPAGQLRPDRMGDAACTQCHEALAEPAALAKHSGHDPQGIGARCRGCHMPDVVYGLVGVRISHRIESPDPARNASAGRPDACTACHVDRSRGWAIEHSGQAVTDHADVAAVTHMLLAGDPIERSVAAHALGRPDVPAPLAPRLGLLLDTMLDDDYAAVRSIAWRSFRRLLGASAPAVTAFEPTARHAERAAVVRELRLRTRTRIDDPPPELTARLRPLAAAVAIEIGE